MTAGRSWAVPLGVGLCGGIASGLLGVGGGIVMVPLLVALVGLGQHHAHATSLAAIVPIAAAGALTFAGSGEVDLGLAALLALGGLLGAPLGARIMARTTGAALRVMFGLLTIAVSIQLLWP